MENLTYEQLLEHLQKMPKERLKDNVTVYLSGFEEYFPVVCVSEAIKTDVLDHGHTFLTIEA